MTETVETLTLSQPMVSALSLPVDIDASFSPPATSVAISSTRTGELETASLDRGQFDFIGMIGRGGFGEVWTARQATLGRTVAVKRVRPDLVHGAFDDHERRQLIESFHLEAATAASLEHPNIVPIYDLGTDDNGNPLLAMRYMRGTPWNRLMRDDFTTLAVEEFLHAHVSTLIQVAQAIAYAHSRGIMHRDIKPQQVMVGEFGEVVLMDWGLAVVFEGDETQRQHDDGFYLSGLDLVPNPAGTVAYMAPEQTEITGSRLGPWTDVYLLGGCLYLLLTGKRPHEGARDVAFSDAGLGNVVPIEQAAGGRHVPDELARLAMEALRREPENRLPSALAFVDGLKAWLSGATRRRDAEGLLARAVTLLEKSTFDDETQHQCLSILDQAHLAWPTHPTLVSVRDRALIQSAAAARKDGDLSLAMTHARRIADIALQKRVVDEVSKARSAALRRKRRRSLIFKVSAVLAIVAICGGSLLLNMAYARHADAVSQRILAETNLAEAKALNAQLSARLLELAAATTDVTDPGKTTP